MIMLNNLFYQKLYNHLKLPVKAQALMLDVYNKVGELSELQNKMFDKDFPVLNMCGDTNAKANEAGIHEYTFAYYLCIISAKRMYENYEKENIRSSVFDDTILDLKCKLEECYMLHDIYGTFVFLWYPDMYRLNRFAFGRLQYDIAMYNWDTYNKLGFKLEEGDRVYNCHIPSMGPLTEELCMDSYKKAYDFFGQHPLFIGCWSWMLYPGHYEFLPQNSRILRFMNDFDIIESQETENFGEAWRLYGKNHTLPPEQWQEDTSLQRAYKSRILAGLPVGAGKGILVFDGNKIVNK